MSDISNKQRAEWAMEGLTSYARAKSTVPGLYDDIDVVLTDLLCDLMHLARRENIDFAHCAHLARRHHDAERREESNPWGLECPQCKAGDQIDIAASVWVRLCRDGTDVTAAANGDHEWDDSHAAVCCACGHAGTVRSFEPQEDAP